MNVKVLFLPDGQDPDDFARSRSSEELQAYIEQNRTDFIVFRTQALLQGVTDPVRRAEAVNQIVRSIAVIRDPIVRASYLRECAHRTDVREDTLIAQMNRFIYQGQGGAPARGGACAGQPGQSAAALRPSQSHAAGLEGGKRCSSRPSSAMVAR